MRQALRVALTIYAATAVLALLADRALAYPVWGNDRIADCTFAAAADWMILDLGYTPDETTIIRQFHRAGGEDEEGIYQDQFQRYWQRHGIAGVRAKMSPVSFDRVGRYLAREPLILAFDMHEVVLVKTVPQGLRYITYGEERTMSWRELHRTNEGIWSVAVIP